MPSQYAYSQKIAGRIPKSKLFTSIGLTIIPALCGYARLRFHAGQFAACSIVPHERNNEPQCRGAPAGEVTARGLAHKEQGAPRKLFADSAMQSYHNFVYSPSGQAATLAFAAAAAIQFLIAIWVAKGQTHWFFKALALWGSVMYESIHHSTFDVDVESLTRP